MRKLLLGTLCVAMLGIVNSALGIDLIWDDETGNHRMLTAQNWDRNQLPPGKWWVFVDNVPAYPGVGAVLDDYTSKNWCYGLLVGTSGPGNMTLRNDTGDPWGVRVKAKATVKIGNGSTGTVDIISAGDGLVVGDNLHVGADGGSGVININAPLDPGIGYGARLLVRSRTYIGDTEGSTGVVNLIDGNFDANVRAGHFVFNVGYYGDGIINISGGTIDILGRLDVGGYYNVGDGTFAPNASGHIEMTGGLIMADHIYFGLNSKYMNDPIPKVTGTIHQTGGEFIFDGPNQTLALSRVNQAINRGWWTTGPKMLLNVSQDAAGTHVTVIPPLEVDVDILPCDDPNMLTVNTQGKGRLPIAILGSEEYDINEIDLDSLNIAATVLPVKEPKIGEDVNGDGILDLMIHVSRRDLILALGLDQMEPGTVVPVTIEGTLSNGRFVFGTDDVVLVARED